MVLLLLDILLTSSDKDIHRTADKKALEIHAHFHSFRQIKGKINVTGIKNKIT